jgi:NAD(P)H dehydrogenase (quinone)
VTGSSASRKRDLLPAALSRITHQEDPVMSERPKVAVIYYSATGTVHQLAEHVARGALEAGAEVRLLRVLELAPKAAIDSNPAWSAHVAATEDVPVATGDDAVWADGIVFGSPTRFGNISSQLKQFIDTLGGAWARGLLADKVYSGFTATSTAHGGQESTLLALYNSVHHFGGLVVAPGYTDPSKYVDGNPYGTSHVSGQNDIPVDDAARNSAAFQGRRVATIAARLLAGQAVPVS